MNGFAVAPVVDAGARHDSAPHPLPIDRKVAAGTRIFTQERAITGGQAMHALDEGAALACDMARFESAVVARRAAHTE